VKPITNIAGQTFGIIEVLRLSKHRKIGNRLRVFWDCKCKLCGVERCILGDNLRSSTRKPSCACQQSARLSMMQKSKVTHGMSGTPIGRAWTGMVQRCYNTNLPDYESYGGRGIVMCEFLKASPLNLVLIVGDKPSKRHSVDRKNNDGSYTCGTCPQCVEKNWPQNIRWATPSEQARNRRSSRFVTCNGQTHTIAEWVEITGYSQPVIWRRANEGKDLLAPIDISKRNKRCRKEEKFA